MTRHVAVVGGGISGLATAYYLQKYAQEGNFSVRTTLIEKDTRLGGKVLTEHVEGCVIEGGPDAMLTLKPWAIQLCKELGLADQLISPQPNRKTYVLQGEKFRLLPRGAMGFIPSNFSSFLSSDLFSLRGKLRMGCEVLIPKYNGVDDESLGSFIHRRLGKESLERLAEPLLAGVYAADAYRLSVKATYPSLLALEKKHGNLILGALAYQRKHPSLQSKKPIFASLRLGLSSLIETLESQLNNTTLIRGERVLGLKKGKNENAYELLLESGLKLTADEIVLATPTYVASELLANLNSRASQLLSQIQSASTAVVTMAFPRRAIFHPLDATGFLIPRTEKRSLTACTWSSSKWPGRAPEDVALFRCFFGKMGHEDALQLQNDELVHLALSELCDLLEISDPPSFSRVHRWAHSMPQYEVGHLERLSHIYDALTNAPGIHLVGAGYRGVGLPDCIRQAKEAAQQILK